MRRHVIIIATTLHCYLEQLQSPVSISFIFHDLTKRISTYIKTAVVSDFFIWVVMDVSVAFVVRRGGALWRISEMLSQLTFSMGSGMVLFHGNSDYVVLTKSCYAFMERVHIYQ